MSLFDPTLTAAAQAAPIVPPVPAVAFTGLGDDAWLDASRALSLDNEPHIPGLVRPFNPWQSAAYQYALDSIARWGGVIIGDDMGLGKTAVQLALAAEWVRRTGRHAIIVAPPVVAGGYLTELQACFPHLTLSYVSGHKRRALDPADIYLISDDSRTMATWLTDVSTDANGKRHHHASAWVQGASIVCRDELHRDKGNNGKPTGRAKVMLAVGEYCRSVGTPVVGATGTLLSNGVIEAYLPLQIVGGERVVKAITPGAHNIKGFLWRYCAPSQGVAAGGRKYTKYGIDPDTALTLHENLRRTLYVRREKSDLPSYCEDGHANAPDAADCMVCGEPVIPVIPHSGWIIVPQALPDGTMRRYARVEHDFFNLCAEERGQVWADKVARAQAVVQMGMLREEAGVAKAEAAADYIADLVLEEGRQVVAFYDHKRVWEKLALALLGKGVTVTSINGNVTGDDRADAIAEFQAGDAQVCLAQIKAAGVGVTLTAAADAVFVQCGWAAGDLKQCADRILRTDQVTRDRAAAGGKVTWHVLQAHYADGDPTFDSHIWTNVLEKKVRICDAINAGRPVTIDEESVQKEALMSWQPSQRHYKGGW